MRYGYFDRERREYVVERPDTPMSWVNYLGTSEFCSIISNNAAGYSFHKSAKSGRLTRFRFNSVPTDRPGRYVYVRDEEDGDYWSISWQPVGKPIDTFKSECRHGLGYTRFESEYKGIRASQKCFVPVDKNIEIWEVEVENTSGRARQLSLFGFVEWCFWDMMQDLINFQYILYTCNMSYQNDVVNYGINLWPQRFPKGFMASILPAASFETDRDVFFGNYRHEGQPQAVEKGYCDGTLAVGGNPCAAIQNKINLAPGEKIRAGFIVGIGDGETFGQECRDRYRDPSEVQKELDQVQAYWDSRLAGYTCATPSDEVNIMANMWNQYQCHTTFNWSRSASFNEAGGRDGLGYRDTNQDTLAVVHAIPGAVREKLIDLLHGQASNGSAMHTIQPLEWKQDKANVPTGSHLYSDDHLWLLLSIPAYLKETGDFGFLDEVVEYTDEGSASVYEHMKMALEFSWSKRGPHDLMLGLNADWNDCINLRGNGESTWSSQLFHLGCTHFIEIAKRLGKTEDAELIAGYREGIRKSLEQTWDGEWFVRGYLDDGSPLGSKSSEQSKIFINSQTWAVVSGAADPEKGARAMDSLNEHLATPYGIVINFPAYRKQDLLIGAITSFPPGLKENSGIFCHANTWAIVAETILGRGDRAFQHYRSFLPAARNDDAENYTMEPYVYSQFITGKEHPYKFGRARNSWLTGTASWSFVALSQYILGIRADYDGLVVDPCIPKDWDGFTATRVYRGKTFKITVKNPSHISKGVREMIVNGAKVDGNVVPLAGSIDVNEVTVTLG